MARHERKWTLCCHRNGHSARSNPLHQIADRVLTVFHTHLTQMMAVNSQYLTFATVTVHTAQSKVELRKRMIKVKVGFTLEQATKAQTGRSKALLFL